MPVIVGYLKDELRWDPSIPIDQRKLLFILQRLVYAGLNMNVNGSEPKMRIFWEHLLCPDCTEAEKKSEPFQTNYEYIKKLSRGFFDYAKHANGQYTNQNFNDQ